MLLRCVIAAVRGMGADFPCPVCLIPKDELPGLGRTFPARTTAEMREVYQRAQSADTLAERNTILQAVGLRDVEVCFMFGTLDFVTYQHCPEHFLVLWTHRCLHRSRVGPSACLPWWAVQDTHPPGAPLNDRKGPRLNEPHRSPVRCILPSWAITHMLIAADNRLDATPRWRDLSHFSHISQFNEFSDGRKYEDLSKAS